MDAKELKELLSACNSVKSETKLSNGKTIVVFKERAILDRKGQPISIDAFEQEVGHRVYLQPESKEPMSAEDIKAVKSAKKNWKKYHKGYKTSSMKLIPGNRFQRQIIMKTLNLN